MKGQKVERRTTETITISRVEYDSLKGENAELSQKVDWLMEQLRLLRKKRFGAPSEQTKEQLDGQLSLLFNEASAGMEMESKNQIGAQRSGSGLERRGKGAERGMPAGRSETERTLP